MWKFTDTLALAKASGFTTYAGQSGAYLRSEHWRNLKYEAGIDQHTPCCVCHGTSGTLAHHIRYRKLIDVIPPDLAPMCEDCHEEFHLTCRRDGIDHIDKEIPDIIRITKAFQVKPDGSERRERIETKRLERTGKRKKLRQPLDIKHRIRKAYGRFLRGDINSETAATFCRWITMTVGNIKPPEDKALSQPYATLPARTPQWDYVNHRIKL